MRGRGGFRRSCARRAAGGLLAAAGAGPATAPTRPRRRAPPHRTAAPAQPEPPADSGLAIKRGVAMLAQDRMTFRPAARNPSCGCSTRATAVRQTFATRCGWVRRCCTSKRTASAPRSRKTSPKRAGTQACSCSKRCCTRARRARSAAATRQQELHRRGARQRAVLGCRSRRGRHLWRQPAEPKEITLGAPQTQDAEGAVRYHASGNGHELDCSSTRRPAATRCRGVFRLLGARDARRQGIQRLRTRWKIVSRANARGRMR